VDALLWAIPAVLALAALALLLCLLPEQHRSTAMRAALGLWIAITLVALPVLLSRS
jgi:drug/metabolite transporter superfamily protein YnfA